jgi:hypothetical protein
VTNETNRACEEQEPELGSKVRGEVFHADNNGMPAKKPLQPEMFPRNGS